MLLEQKAISFSNNLKGAFYYSSLRNMQTVLSTNFASTDLTFSASFTYHTDKPNSKRLGSIRIKDNNAGA